MNFLITKIESY